jgi:probable addiction module antidote protein
VQDISTALKLARFLSENPMTETKAIPWNPKDHPKTPGDIAAYLEAVFEDGDPELISHSLGAVARSKGMTEIAHRTGSGRQSLYKALSSSRKARNPSYSATPFSLALVL